MRAKNERALVKNAIPAPHRPTINPPTDGPTSRAEWKTARSKATAPAISSRLTSSGTSADSAGCSKAKAIPNNPATAMMCQI